MLRLVGNVKCTRRLTALVTANTALPYTKSSFAVLNHAMQIQLSRVYNSKIKSV